MVNHDARRERHQKLFGKTHAKVARWRQLRNRNRVHANNARTRFSHPLLGHSPAQRILQRVVATSFVFLLINSMNFASAHDVGGTYIDAFEDLSISADLSLVSDEEGYLTKAMPLEGEARYLNRGKDMVTHEVQYGETLSVIAYRYDLDMDTILWANPSLGSGSLLKVGQELKIPPADGLYIEVEDGDTWTDLIDDYDSDVSEEDMIAWNEIETLVEGEDVFVLGGEKPQPVYVATTTTSRDYTSTQSTTRSAPVEVTPVVVGDGTWVRPTSGSLTQGYHYGHYAYDIADRSQPPIVAVASGTVVRAEYGWNGGYGNVIVIDHGNGYQSLYAHNEELYVSYGQVVDQGQVISKMGNSGRVYGVTGIHLHFELSYNGSKIEPGRVFGW